jgi:hypothetical protein
VLCMEAVAQTPSDSLTTQRWEKTLAIPLYGPAIPK